MGSLPLDCATAHTGDKGTVRSAATIVRDKNRRIVAWIIPSKASQEQWVIPLGGKH